MNVKKKILAGALVVATTAFLLVGCGHEHSWVEATCTEPKTCECGEIEGEALGHQWIEATCTEPITCSVCGEVTGSAKGHQLDNWSVSVDSTCAETGLEIGFCSICEESSEREIPLKEHVLGDWVVTKEPTETEKGTRVKACVNCGADVEKEEFSMSKEEIEKRYKNSCETISYKNLSRTPDKYEGRRVKFRGKVLQVCSEASSSLYYSTYRVATSGSYDNVVYLYVDNYGSGERILEDDWITFYGEYDGLYTYETVMGASKTIPSIKAKYVD